MEHEDGVKMAGDLAAVLAKDAVPGLGLASELVGAIGRGLGGSGDDRFEQAVAAEIHDATFKHVPELQGKVAQLERDGVRVNVTDIARVMMNYGRAWRDSADTQKRKLLEAAFLRSFDKDMYESGLLNALWERLDRLAYGDLHLLKELAPYGMNAAPPESLRHRIQNQESLGKFHVLNLVREGLAWHPQRETDRTGDFRATELGRRLRDLAWGADSSNSP